MSQFDQTTEKKAEDHSKGCAYRSQLEHSFAAGRKSTKASMVLACGALKKRAEYFLYNGEPANEEAKAIAEIKARGDWCLEE